MRTQIFVIALLTGGCFSWGGDGGCTDPGPGPILDNSSFREWCNGVPCNWQIESGSVRPASTWNAHDLAVELGPPTTILGQDANQQTASDTRVVNCIQLRVLGDFDPAAQLSVRFSNGKGEYVYPLGSATWEPIRTAIRLGNQYVFHVSVEKRGSGHAVLSDLTLESSTACASDAPAVLPDGEPPLPAPSYFGCDDYRVFYELYCSPDASDRPYSVEQCASLRDEIERSCSDAGDGGNDPDALDPSDASSDDAGSDAGLLGD